MKHFLGFVLFSFLFSNAGAQTQPIKLPMTNGKIIYEVIDTTLQGKTKAQLYSAFKLWAFDNFVDLNHVLQIDDSTNGIMAGKSQFSYYINFLERSGVYKIEFSFTTTLKDGKYKTQFYNFWLSDMVNGGGFSLAYALARPKKLRLHRNYLVRIEGTMKYLTESLKSRMQSDGVTGSF